MSRVFVAAVQGQVLIDADGEAMFRFPNRLSAGQEELVVGWVESIDGDASAIKRPKPASDSPDRLSIVRSGELLDTQRQDESAAEFMRRTAGQFGTGA